MFPAFEAAKNNILQRQAKAMQLQRIDLNLQLLNIAAEHVNIGNARNSLQARHYRPVDQTAQRHQIGLVVLV